MVNALIDSAAYGIGRWQRWVMRWRCGILTGRDVLFAKQRLVVLRNTLRMSVHPMFQS